MYIINAWYLLVQTGKAKVYSLSFGGTGKFPMTEWLAMTGRAGINAWQCMYTGEGVRNGNPAYFLKNQGVSVKPYYSSGIEISQIAGSNFSGLIEWSRYNGRGSFGEFFKIKRDIDMDYLREACDLTAFPLAEIVEIDETYIDGKEANRHAAQKTPGRQGNSIRNA